MGHEASGIVLDIGEGVKKVKKDDYVVVSWIKGEGIEAEPPKYKSKKGLVSAGPAATFLEYAVISENRVVPIDKKVKASIAALLGCAVPTGMGIVKGLNMKEGQKIVVFGIGGIGACALLKAKSLGAQATAVDIVDWKLKWAKEELGADEVIKPGQLSSKDFDFAIECSGNKKAMETAFECVKDSGTVVIAGNLEPGEKISIDPFSLIKGKKIYGTWGGETILDLDIPGYVKEYLNGNLKLDKLITAEYRFDDINQGLRDLENGKLIRGVVKISD